jgi:hypothetical protein
MNFPELSDEDRQTPPVTREPIFEGTHPQKSQEKHRILEFRKFRNDLGILRVTLCYSWPFLGNRCHFVHSEVTKWPEWRKISFDTISG